MFQSELDLVRADIAPDVLEPPMSGADLSLLKSELRQHFKAKLASEFEAFLKETGSLEWESLQIFGSRPFHKDHSHTTDLIDANLAWIFLPEQRNSLIIGAMRWHFLVVDRHGENPALYDREYLDWEPEYQFQTVAEMIRFSIKATADPGLLDEL